MHRGVKASMIVYFTLLLEEQCSHNTGMHKGVKASMIVYFTLLLEEQCSHMMINRTLEHVHHNVLMIASLLIVNAPYIPTSL